MQCLPTVVLATGGNDCHGRQGGAAAAHLAACQGHTAVLACLLEHGVHPGATSLDGWSLLHEAAATGHADAVRLLLQRGADPEVLDSHGKTAHQVARAHGHTAAAALLPGGPTSQEQVIGLSCMQAGAAAAVELAVSCAGSVCSPSM